MGVWQQEKTLLDNQLADPNLYAQNDKTLLQTLLKQQSEVTQKLEVAEMRWLELHEQLEALPAIQ